MRASTNIVAFAMLAGHGTSAFSPSSGASPQARPLGTGASAFSPPSQSSDASPQARPLGTGAASSPLLHASAAGLDGVRPDLAAAYGRLPPLVDEDAELAKASFPIPPETLIGLTKAWLASQIDDDGMDWFADDFRFVAPVVGPFDKAEFTDSLKGFEVRKAFPDLESNPHHFRVCPFEPNRVWWSVKYVGTNTGPILGGPATMRAVESPVQAQSATFNERGEIRKFTIGYVLDKETGNTGGLGGVFGLFYAIGRGLPFPEAQPWKASPLYGLGMGFNKQIQNAFKANPALRDGFFSTVSSVGNTSE